MTSKHRISLLLTLFFVGSALPGCGGPSTEDLMMRAAMRTRPRSGDLDEEEEKKPPKSPKKPAKKDVAKAEPSPSAKKADATDMRKVSRLEKGKKSVKAKDVLATLDQLSLKPISERKPEGEVSENDRRKMAADNLMKIHGALEAYYEEHDFYPPRAFITASGFKTLSWRVEILPYLGYQDLYDKFDHGKPWNLEPNKTLMNYIPPEFTSDRYDVKTNFLLPAYGTFFFGPIRDIDKQSIEDEDGIANTIMLVEVNDNLAVEWTRPGDYEPKTPNSVKRDVGKVRGDGAFAVWGNGWPVLLSNSLSSKQFSRAFTATAGDSQRAAEVHRDIPLSDQTDAEDAKMTEETPGAEAVAEAMDYPKPTMMEEKIREPMPSASDIAQARNRLKVIFRDQISDAKDDSKKTTLARDMLKESSQMMEDPAGTIALQSAAINLAVEAGEIAPVIAAVDQRVARFEVDSYKMNLDALLQFAEGTTKREPSEVDGAEFLRRAVPVIYAAIEDNDFVRASAIARHAYRLRDQEPDEELQKSLNKLRVLLGTAKREYDKASESLAIYRNDRTQVEHAANFGRFLCFIKGDWQEGLPLVIMTQQSKTRELREVAERDLGGAKTLDEEVALGDSWWELSKKVPNGVYRQALQDRAALWYEKAFPLMPQSLDRIHVKSRLDEMGESDPTSPLALIAKIADESNVNLNVSLASVADGGGRGRSGNTANPNRVGDDED